MKQGRNTRRGQEGNFLVTTLLGLVLAGISAVGYTNAKSDELKRGAGMGEATILANLQGGVNVLISNEWTSFQAGAPVTRSGVTVTPTVVGGELVWEPTIAQLNGMGVLPAGWTTTRSSINGAPLRVRILRSPAGCSPATCFVEGRLWADAPYTSNSVANSSEARIVGPILTKIGADAGVSLPNSAGQITGYGNTWTNANPVAGAPPGVVMIRVGDSSAAFAQFLRIGDARDPAFRGPMTVAGNTRLQSNLNVDGDTVVSGRTTVNGLLTAGGPSHFVGGSTFDSTVEAAGAITSRQGVTARDPGGCDRVVLNNNGEVSSKDAGCVTRVFVNPADGSTSSRDGAGTTRAALLGSSGQVLTFNAGGAATTSLDGSSGRISGANVNPYSSASAGTTCAGNAEGDLVRDAQPDGTVLACRAGVWRRPGLQLAAEASGCTQPGVVGVDAANRGLICRGGAWRLLNDRVASVVPMQTFGGQGSGVVPGPACGPGGSPELQVSPVQSGADYGTNPPRNRFALSAPFDAGTWTWTVTPVLVDPARNVYTADSTGQPYAFGWTAITLCNYGGT